LRSPIARQIAYPCHETGRIPLRGLPETANAALDDRDTGGFLSALPLWWYVEQSELTGAFRVDGYGSGNEQHVGGKRTRMNTMAKPKRGRSTAAIDDHVGGRIRERRIMLGLTQQQLAEMIGVTYQQAHKYERGINRVSAGRLFEIARALSAPITYFYEGIGQEGPRQITPHQRMLLEIARNFAEIRNEKHQEAVSQLARALASR
jgi:transcriptional regulator with XRE-family HTH domain